MLKTFKTTVLFLACCLCFFPATSFAYLYGNGYWNYHGSGRDYAYSDYIDLRYTPSYDYALYPDVDDDIPDGVTALAPVPAQAVVLPSDDNEFTVNIPNTRGGYTAVVIKRSGNGYIGPQGEFYPEFPTVSELKIIYGK